MKKLIIVLITILVFGITIYTLISTKEREVYLSDISPDYYTVGYYDLCFNEDYNKNSISVFENL